MSIIKTQNIYGNMLNPTENPYYYRYFEIEALTSGVFLLSIIVWEYGNTSTNINLYYSKNNSNWTLFNQRLGISVNSGDKISFKADFINDYNNGLFNNFSNGSIAISITEEATTIDYNCYGNIMSLLNGDNFKENSEFPKTDSINCFEIFNGCFYDTNIIDASNLILPSKNLPIGCYTSMFSYCLKLQKLPTIYPSILSDYCYQFMFEHAGELVYTGADAYSIIDQDITIPAPLGTTIALPDFYDFMFYNSKLVDNKKFIYTLNKNYIDYCINDSRSRTTYFMFYLDWDINSDIKVILPWEECIIYKNINLYVESSEELQTIIDYYLEIGIISSVNDVISIKYKYNRYESVDHSSHGDDDSFALQNRNRYIYTDDIFGQVMQFCFVTYDNKELPVSNEQSNIIKDFVLSELQRMFNPDYAYSALHISFLEPLQYYKSIPLTFETITPCTFEWDNVYYDEDNSINLQYSFNGIKWIDYKNGIQVKSGQTIYWRNNMTIEQLHNSFINSDNLPKLKSYYNYSIEDGTVIHEAEQRFNISGNIMSLLCSDFENVSEIPFNNCFQNIFASTCVVDASNLVLPAITLMNNCYSLMFDNCKYLKYAPKILPAKYIKNVDSAYAGMFRNCENLVSPPVLMAVSLADRTIDSNTNKIILNNCSIRTFKEMFLNCTNLSKAPDIYIDYASINTNYIDMQSNLNLIDNYKTENFYDMFKNCHKLEYLTIYTHNHTLDEYQNANYNIEFNNTFVSGTLQDVEPYYHKINHFSIDKSSRQSVDLYLTDFVINQGTGTNLYDLYDNTISELPEIGNVYKLTFIRHDFDGRNDTIEIKFPDLNINYSYSLLQLKDIINSQGLLQFYDTGVLTIDQYVMVSNAFNRYYNSSRTGIICNSDNSRDVVASAKALPNNSVLYINRYTENI